MSEPIKPQDERVTLSPSDAAAVDALLESAHPLKLAGVGADAERRARVQTWLKLLGSAPMPEAPAGLAERTLAAVADDRMKLQPRPSEGELVEPAVPRMVGGGAGAGSTAVQPLWRRRHVAEVAAMLVAGALLVAVIIPTMSAARRSNARVACAGNLKTVSAAFATYTAAFSGQLPSLAMPENRNWLQGDSDTAARTNAANLIPLLNAAYIQPDNLYCAGRPPVAGTLPASPDGGVNTASAKNDLPGIGYSYINLYGPVRPTWNRDHANIILADRNPLLIDPTDPPDSPDVNSPNHQRLGNYVVRADQSVTWEISPNCGPANDNIWTIGTGTQRHTRFTGTEVPASPADIFLIP